MRPERTTPGPGEIVAGHRIEAELGHGGMGVVYLATELALERTVALKLIAPQFGSDDGFRARFWREARLAAALEHPNVLPIYKAGEEEGALFISMRYVEGSDLAGRMATGRLEPAHAVGIVAQVAAALDAAHARGLIHRDVKPSNILLETHGGVDRAYLSDFGLAKVSDSASQLTRTGQLLGTLDYVSPEQIRGENVDARSDVYSLGCVLYEALTGSVPFPRGDDLAKLWAHMHEPPPSLLELAPGLPPALDATVRRSLAKQPDDRFASASELGREAAAASTTAERGRARTRRPRRPAQVRRRVWLVGGIVLLFAALVIGAVGLWIARDDGNASRGAVAGTPITVPSPPDRVALAGGDVWTLTTDGGLLVRVDPDSGEAELFPAPLDLGGGVFPDFAGTPTALWLAHANPTVGGVDRIDPGTVEAVERITLPSAHALAATSDGVWATTSSRPGSGQTSGSLARIDPRTTRIVSGPRPVGRAPSDVAAGFGGVWVADRARDEVVRVSPGTLEIEARVRVGNEPTLLALTEDLVWVVNAADRTLTRIDPSRNEAIGVPLAFGKQIDDLVYAAESLWLAGGDGTVTELDPRTGAVRASPLRLGGAPLSLASDRATLWVASALDRTVRPVTVSR